MWVKSLDQAWRLLATAISFVIFGLGGLLLALLVVPLLSLIADKIHRQRLFRQCIHRLFQFYIGFLKFLGIASVNIIDREKLKHSRLILANHPTLIDALFLLAVIPNANCVVKKSLARNVFTQAAIKAAGYIVNHDNPHEVIRQAEQAFQLGDVVIIFPEGTRSNSGESIKLKGGAAIIALRANIDVTPVTIQCDPVTLSKGMPWYQIPLQKPHFVVQVQDLIAINPYRQQGQSRLAARLLTSDLTQYMNKELGLYE